MGHYSESGLAAAAILDPEQAAGRRDGIKVNCAASMAMV
jgi:hypothetical protein